VKLLLVSHNYPPEHRGGTELYTAQLALGMRERGHEVVVFTATKDISRADRSLHEREHEGVRVHELVNNLGYEAFRETWDFPPAERAFVEVLEREQPELVHFNHLLYLSVGCVEAARRRRLPVVFTLHDYWLQCARFGQRVHADRSVCHEIEASRCADCLGSFRYRNSAWEQRVAGWVARFKEMSGVDLAPGLRVAGDWLRALEDEEETPALPLEEVTVRDRELRERLLAGVDRFLSPSAFLRKRLVEWGIPPERIEHLPTGTDLELFGSGERESRGDRLRFGFLGSLVPVKGPHVALRAWAGLEREERGRASFELFGPSFHDSEYQGELEELARESGARLAGSLEREEVAAALRRLDLLIVPSLWYENQPLVILEALAARTPLAVSDLGGMAELVEAGVSGFRFPMGDVRALRGLMRDLLADPSQLDRLYATPPAIPTVADQLDGLERVYAELAGASA